MNTIPLISAKINLSSPEIQQPSKSQRIYQTPIIDKITLENTNPEEKPVTMLIELIKSSLSGAEPDKKVFKGATYHDWSKLLEMSNRASMTGFAFDSISKLPKGSTPSNIVLKMNEFVKEIEGKYARQEAVLGDISEQLSKKGIETIALKGLGLSLNYPIPQHRHGRDIDIFTRLKGTVTEDRSNATEILDDMMVEKGINVEDYKEPKAKHSEFFYKDLMIENHKYFVNKESFAEAKMIDELLHKKLNPVEKILPNGTKILVPSTEFNTIFLAQHAFQHYAVGGIDLHNLVDWSMHIKENGLQIPKELKGTKLETFMYALTNVSNKHLGTNVKVPDNPEYEKKLFKKILHPEATDLPPKGIGDIELVIFKAKRMLKNHKERKELTGRSLTNTILASIKHKIRHPESVLRRL